MSGSLTFFVSGRKRVKIPAINDVKPKINNGAAGLITAFKKFVTLVVNTYNIFLPFLYQ